MTTGTIANYRFYLRQRPVMLVLLSVLAIIFFLTVTGLARAYREQRQALGDRWFHRGVADLNAKQFDAALTEFRSALLYSRDNYSYQLNLAEALIGLRRTGQASAYLLNLWEREPEDGLVNLELARIAAQQGQTDQAVRYYHNAVYATWSESADQKRRDARLELIELLLRIRDRAQAQAELIALAANVGTDPALQERIGELFLRAQDYEHALAAYRNALRTDRRNPAALAGAGEAAFELSQYAIAQRYLQAAVAVDPRNAQSADLLETAEMVVNLDPFRPQASAAVRNQAVLQAFAIAGQRLKSCPLPTAPGSGPPLSTSWDQLKPRMNESMLQRHPDLSESAMDLVFRIEHQTNDLCRAATGQDLALLLIAKLHEGN